MATVPSHFDAPAWQKPRERQERRAEGINKKKYKSFLQHLDNTRIAISAGIAMTLSGAASMATYYSSASAKEMNSGKQANAAEIGPDEMPTPVSAVADETARHRENMVAAVEEADMGILNPESMMQHTPTEKVDLPPELQAVVDQTDYAIHTYVTKRPYSANNLLVGELWQNDKQQDVQAFPVHSDADIREVQEQLVQQHIPAVEQLENAEEQKQTLERDKSEHESMFMHERREVTSKEKKMINDYIEHIMKDPVSKISGVGLVMASNEVTEKTNNHKAGEALLLKGMEMLASRESPYQDVYQKVYEEYKKGNFMSDKVFELAKSSL